MATTGNPNMDQFVQCLTANQGRLYAYILSLLPDADRAHDVLQQTNLVLWRKAGEFTANTRFVPWACKIAWYEVLSHRRDQRRERLRFDDGLLEQLAGENELAAAESDDDARQLALRKCLGELPSRQRELLESRYSGTHSVQSLAKQAGRSVGSISQTLYRIRQGLLGCIEQRIAAEAAT